MNNIPKIILLQYVPAYGKQQLQKIRNKFFRKAGNDPTIIENIDYFKSDAPKTKRALISLSPSAWLRAVNEYPNIKMFNYVGLTFEIVKALNEKDYLVDIVDLNKEYLPIKKYDLYIGHGGKCRTIINNLSPDTKILQYVSGAYWRLFNEESEERYNAFIERKNVKEKLTFTRSLEGLIEGEEYLTNKAHVLFFLNCPRMVESFGEYKQKFFFTGYGAYLDELLYIPPNEKNFEAGRNNFIYVGGTGGNIQKGMDLLIETFTRTPELNLYIYCKVEEEILNYYKTELKAKNIHSIYHWRFMPFQNRLKELMKKINFTIHAGINSGLGTAFMGSMGLGLIPVGYIDLIAPENSCVLSNSWQIDSMVKCIQTASNMPEEWCKNASKLNIKYYDENYIVEVFSNNFKQLITQTITRQ